MTLPDKAATRTDTEGRVSSRGIVSQDVCAITSAQSRLRSTLLVAGIVVIIISGG